MSVSSVSSEARKPAVERFANLRIDGERLIASDTGQAPRLTVCIPAYQDDPSELIRALSVIEGAGAAEIVVYDDGSSDSMLLSAITEAMKTYPGQYMLVSNEANRGRSRVRNRLAAFAASEWLLFLDADMRPDTSYFLMAYLELLSDTAKPSLVVGGFSLQQVKRRKSNRLHYAQSVASDCVSAERRKADPGRFVFTSNLVVHRSILENVPFDEAFKGWGWEDVDWGLRVVETYPVIHVTNTASHLGLYSNSALIRRFGDSGENYARLRSKHPEATSRFPLTRAIRLVKRLPARNALRGFFHFLAEDSIGLVPLSARLFSLKLYRALCYGVHDESKSAR